MFSRRSVTASILVTVGLLLMPTLGLPYNTMDWSAYSQTYGTATATSTFTLSQTATGTATATLTPTHTVPAATSTPTVSPTATMTTTSIETATLTATATPTSTPTPTLTMAATSTATPSATGTTPGSPTPSATPTSTATGGPLPTTTSTATSTATATPTATSAPGTGRIAGKVTVQGRTDAQGVQIEVNGTRVAVTESDGSFEAAGVAPGTHVVRASLAGYLSAEKDGVTVVTGQTTTLPPVKLFGGDADRDSEVGLLDLVLIARNYNTSPPGDPRADINGDGWANLFDLVLVASNYRRAGPIPWP
ncbi:MAG: carboxypeptidase regulatory-like domain-containing protein [Anaerolineae bacterium]